MVAQTAVDAERRAQAAQSVDDGLCVLGSKVTKSPVSAIISGFCALAMAAYFRISSAGMKGPM